MRPRTVLERLMQKTHASTRLAGFLLVLHIGVLWAAEAADAAAGFPRGASSRQEAIHDLFVWTLASATLLTLTVLVPLVVLAWRRRGDAPPRDWRLGAGRRRVVIATYVLVPTLVICGLGVASYDILLRHEKAPPADLELDVRAARFAWHVTYPEGAETRNDLYVNEGDVVLLRLRSDDVIHSLFIPAMGVKMDAMPGREARTWFEADTVGTYPARCAEFCGVGHPGMTLNVTVLPAAEPVPPRAALR